MKTVAFVLGAVAATADGASSFLRRSARRARTKTMKAVAPFYHSTDDIRQELRRLADSCPGLTLQSGSDSERGIDVVTIRAPGASPTNKNFFLFGEHARELISPESGLHLVKSLCGETDLAEQAKRVLQDSEFQIVVNGNPGSRVKVEQGDFCRRTNPDGVDLNRNWDEEWQPGAVLDSVDTNPGNSAFSEPETQTFKKLVEDYRPTTFLTIHSGTKGMYMPWAYDMQHLAKRNQPEMMQILKDLDKNHCECPFGAAGREVGYSCPGTCLDYVYDKLQAPYAFAFEIYTGPDFAIDLKQRWLEKVGNADGAFVQESSHLAHEHFKEIFEAHPSSFVQVRAESKARDARSPEVCFSQFNPPTEAEYRGVIDNWSAAYLDMAEMVAANLKRGNSNSSITNSMVAA